MTKIKKTKVGLRTLAMFLGFHHKVAHHPHSSFLRLGWKKKKSKGRAWEEIWKQFSHPDIWIWNQKIHKSLIWPSKAWTKFCFCFFYLVACHCRKVEWTTQCLSFSRQSIPLRSFTLSILLVLFTQFSDLFLSLLYSLQKVKAARVSLFFFLLQFFIFKYIFHLHC